MQKMKKHFKVIVPYFAVALLIGATVVLIPKASVNAANDIDLTQTINAGTLTTDVRDASRVSVANPTFALGTSTFSFDCQTTTGTMGTNSQRIYVDNPDAADNGWTLTIAATGGATTLWQNGGSTQNFDFNDPTSSGCSDGADTDTKGGQLTLDPSVSTITTDCASCATTNITKGSSTAYNQGTTDSVTLLNAAAASNDVGRWYLTDIGLSQKIPAEQPVDSYTLNLTVTVTAS